MKSLKFIGYLVLVIVFAPLAWVLRPAKAFDGETFGEYDDDDLGDDVDPEDVP